MKKPNKIVSVVIIMALFGSAAFGWWRYRQAHQEPPIVYKTAKAEPHDIVGKVTASGTLAATVTVQVGTQVSGRIKELFADYNSPVKKGQVVAKIDPLLFEAAVEQANANWLSAQANVVKAKASALDADRQFARTRALRDGQLASQKDFETAETTAQVAQASVGVAEAQRAQARAALNQAKVNLSYTNIVSPIDGTVISRSVDVGQTVAASLQAPVIFTIAEDLRKMQVNTNVAESDVGRIEPNMDVSFTVDAYPGQRFKGRIGQIRNAAQTTQNVVTYDAVIDVDNTDLKLRPGMTANTTIVYAKREAVLSVPNAALRFRPPETTPAPDSPQPSPVAAGRPGFVGARNKRDGTQGETKTVWVLRNGAPVQVQVRVGLSDGTWTEISSPDISAGDEAIVDATVTGKSPAPAQSNLPRGGRIL